jgi:hypothetical protein
VNDWLGDSYLVSETRREIVRFVLAAFMKLLTLGGRTLARALFANGNDQALLQSGTDGRVRMAPQPLDFCLQGRDSVGLLGPAQDTEHTREWDAKLRGSSPRSSFIQ